MNGPITENAAFTQNPVQVTVQTNPTSLTFSVDGTSYTSAQTFSWQPGSSHTIATTSPQDGGTGVRYVWTNWSGGGAISHTVAPTTNKTYTANFKTQYFLTMSSWNRGHSESQLAAGETVEQLFRLVPCRLPVTVSPIGPGAERAHFLGRTIRLQLQWADPSQKRRLSLIIDANTCGVHRPRPTCGTTMIESV